MLVNKNEKHAFSDVDDTLVMIEGNIFQPGVGRMKFIDPYTGESLYLRPNKKHIMLLKAQKRRGYHVTVWSQNGWAWAETVVKTLGLEEYVDQVQTKMAKYIDDLPADKWTSRVYLGLDLYDENAKGDPTIYLKADSGSIIKDDDVIVNVKPTETLVNKNYCGAV